MKKFLLLVRTGLRVNFGLSLLKPKYLFRDKKDLWMVPLIGLGLVGLVPVMIVYVRFVASLYGWISPLGQQAALLTFALLMGQFLVLTFGFYYVISAFYFSRDLELLVPLPLAPSQVLLSKFAVILVNEYLTVSPIVLPVFITYGVLSKGGWGYWVRAVGTYLLLPVIPLAVVSLLVVVLMRLVNFGRKKDALILTGSLLMMTLAVGGQFLINRSVGAAPDRAAVVRFLTASDGLVQQIGAKFPPSIWASRALAYGTTAPGPGNALISAGVSLLLFAGLFLAARRFFYRGLIGLGEQTARRRALSRDRLERGVGSGSRPVRAMFVRELRIMNRTPIFLLNGVLSVILIPVLFVVMWNTGKRASDAAALMALVRSADATIAVIAAALFMTISGSLNGTASSTFSREGGQFWMSKVIPVSPADQVRGKLLHSYAIALLGVAASALVVLAVFRLNLAVALAAVALAMAASFVLTAMGMIIDLARPLLTWTNPQKAIKQNFNVLLALFADFGVLFLLYLAVRVFGRMGWTGWRTPAALFVLLAALSAAVFKALRAFAARRYRDIEV
jgi:ABC-2 type transport system permease protein